MSHCLGDLDHLEYRAVLDRTGRVVVLQLRPEPHRLARRQMRQAYQRVCPTDSASEAYRTMNESRSAAGNSGQHHDDVAIRGRGVESTGEADIFIVDVDVHEPA